MRRRILLLIFIAALSGAPAAALCRPAADLVLGQPDFTAWGANQTPGCIEPACQGSPSASTISLDDARFAFDAAGGVWISDKENDRVLRFDPPFYNGMPAALVLGQPNFNSNSSMSSPRRVDAATLYGPMGLAFDAGPDGMRRTADDRLWVVDRANNRILRFDPPFSTGMSAALVLGQPDFTTHGENDNGSIGRLEPVASGFDNPADIAFDSAGNLWVVDTNNHRVLVYFAPIEGTTGELKAALVIGQPDFRSGQPNRGAETPIADGLNAPRAIAIDNDDRVWIVDNDNNRVVQFSPDEMGLYQPALVLGQPDFSANQPYRGQSTPTTDGLRQPTGIAIDLQGGIWLTDPGGNRVVRYNAPVVMNDSADEILKQVDGDAGDSVDASTIARPNGIGVDWDGNVWIADHDLDRILRFGCDNGG